MSNNIADSEFFLLNDHDGYDNELDQSLLALEAHDFEQAIVLSRTVEDLSEQSNLFLYQLGLIMIERWWKTNQNQWTLDTTQASRHSHRDLGTEQAISNLRVGNFTLCVLIAEHFMDDQFRIPTRALKESNLAAHFYLPLEIIEDESIARLHGFVRHDQLLKYVKADRLELEAETDCYMLPLSCCDEVLDHLSIFMHHSDPKLFGLPAKQLERMEWIKIKNCLVERITDVTEEIEKNISSLMSLGTFLKPAQSMANTAWEQECVEFILIKQYKLGREQESIKLLPLPEDGEITDPRSKVMAFIWSDNLPQQDCQDTSFGLGDLFNLCVIWFANEGFILDAQSNLQISAQGRVYYDSTLDSDEVSIEVLIVGIQEKEILISLKDGNGVEIAQWNLNVK